MQVPRARKRKDILMPRHSNARRARQGRVCLIWQYKGRIGKVKAVLCHILRLVSENCTVLDKCCSCYHNKINAYLCSRMCRPECCQEKHEDIIRPEEHKKPETATPGRGFDWRHSSLPTKYSCEDNENDEDCYRSASCSSSTPLYSPRLRGMTSMNKATAYGDAMIV